MAKAITDSGSCLALAAKCGAIASIALLAPEWVQNPQYDVSATARHIFIWGTVPVTLLLSTAAVMISAAIAQRVMQQPGAPSVNETTVDRAILYLVVLVSLIAYGPIAAFLIQATPHPIGKVSGLGVMTAITALGTTILEKHTEKAPCYFAVYGSSMCCALLFWSQEYSVITPFIVLTPIVVVAGVRQLLKAELS